MCVCVGVLVRSKQFTPEQHMFTLVHTTHTHTHTHTHLTRSYTSDHIYQHFIIRHSVALNSIILIIYKFSCHNCKLSEDGVLTAKHFGVWSCVFFWVVLRRLEFNRQSFGLWRWNRQSVPKRWPMKMEQTGCSETLAKLHKPQNNAKENFRHSKYGEILKSRMSDYF
jgi:hypothetical protein